MEGDYLKKLLLFLLVTICLSIVGCSNDKVEEKDNGMYKGTINLKNERMMGSSLFFDADWEYTTNNFTNKIPTIFFYSSKNVFDDKAKTEVTVEIESINKSDKDVYNSLKELTMVDDKDHRGKLITPSTIIDVVKAGKKHREVVTFEFDQVEDYKTMDHVTLKYPIDFGMDDDADHERRYNEITFEFKVTKK